MNFEDTLSFFSISFSLCWTIHDTISDSIFQISIDNSIVAIFEVWYQMNGKKTIISFTWYYSFFVRMTKISTDLKRVYLLCNISSKLLRNRTICWEQGKEKNKSKDIDYVFKLSEWLRMLVNYNTTGNGRNVGVCYWVFPFVTTHPRIVR